MRKKEHPLYAIHMTMKARCYSPGNKDFQRYGAKGVYVCEDWLGEEGFWNFVRDVGPRPDGTSIDRFPDKNGPYTPDNVRWATPVEQTRNRRNTVFVSAFGETKTLVEWAQDPRCRVAYKTLEARIKAGRAPEEAITTPSRMVEPKGKRKR